MLAGEFLDFEIVEERPYNPASFTQGLLLDGGVLYVSTGLYGQSSLQAIEFSSNQVLRQHHLPEKIFGEGATVYGGRIYQLSWKAGMAFVYSQEDFSLLDIFNYEGEGWGLTHLGESLLMSDGSSRLYFRDPQTFAIQRELEVTYQGKPLGELNELECINGDIWANVWGSDQIYIISSETGDVLGVLNLESLKKEVDERLPDANVLNGIAYDAQKQLVWVTGKLWDRLYGLKVDFPRE